MTYESPAPPSFFDNFDATPIKVRAEVIAVKKTPEKDIASFDAPKSAYSMVMS